MPTLDLTAFDAILKEFYIGPIRKQIIDKQILLTRVQRFSDTIDVSGRRAIVPILLGYSEGVGARGDNKALPGAQQTRTIDAIVTVKHNYGRIEITGPTIRASRNDAGAFSRAVDFEVQNMVEGLRKDLNRQLHNDGTGKLAQVNGAVVGLVITVDNPGTLYFKKNMKLEIFDSAFTVQRTGVAQITAVDATASTITVDVVPTGTVDNDFIVREGAKDLEIQGLRGIIDDGTVLATLQGITSATDPEWKAAVDDNSGVLRSLTLPLMQSSFSKAEEQAGVPTLMVTTFNIRDVFSGLLTTEKRFVNTLTLQGGFEALTFNNRPLVPDDQARPNLIYFINEAHMAIHQLGDPDWLQEDGHILKFVTGFDKWEAVLVWSSELATSRRNAHALLADVQ